MTIQEAIKSGKPFRRKIWYEWYTPSIYVLGVCLYNTRTCSRSSLSIEDILADDWEIKED